MDDDAPAPKLPRGSGLKLSGPQLLRIGLTAGLLVLLIVVRKPCSDSVSKFVTDFGSGSGGSASVEMPKPGNVDKPAPGSGDYEVINGDMTPEQIKAAMERARARAAASNPAGREASGGSTGSAAGSAGSGSAGSGSAGSAATAGATK